jgi:hypothetical protein
MPELWWNMMKKTGGNILKKINILIFIVICTIFIFFVNAFSLGGQNNFQLKLDKEGYLQLGYWEENTDNDSHNGAPKALNINLDEVDLSKNIPSISLYESNNFNDVSLTISRVISYLEMSFLQSVDNTLIEDYQYNKSDLCSIDFIDNMVASISSGKNTIPQVLQILMQYGCKPLSEGSNKDFQRFKIDDVKRLTRNFGYVDNDGITNFIQLLYYNIPVVAGMVLPDENKWEFMIGDGVINSDEANIITSKIHGDYESLNAQSVIVSGYNNSNEFLYLMCPNRDKSVVITFDAAKKLLFESYYLLYKPFVDISLSFHYEFKENEFKQAKLKYNDETGFIHIEDVFKLRDRFYLNISLIKSAHLYVKNINPDGEITTLFPLYKNYEHESTWVRFGRDYRLPAGLNNYSFGISSGIDYLVFIVSEEKISKNDLYNDKTDIDVEEIDNLDYLKENIFENLLSDYNASLYVLELTSTE